MDILVTMGIIGLLDPDSVSNWGVGIWNFIFHCHNSQSSEFPDEKSITPAASPTLPTVGTGSGLSIHLEIRLETLRIFGRKLHFVVVEIYFFVLFYHYARGGKESPTAKHHPFFHSLRFELVFKQDSATLIDFVISVNQYYFGTAQLVDQ